MGVDAEMFVRTRQPMSQRDLRNLSAGLTDAFYHDVFLLIPDWTPPTDYGDEEVALADGVIGRHALRFVKYYRQDGPDIHQEHGEFFIEVSLTGRYYGEGYERGNLPLYIAIAEWLEHRIPDAKVYYGGDSSGIYAELFDKKARAEAFAHFARVGHRPYHGGFGAMMLDGNPSQYPVCGFCGPRMETFGGGRGASFFGCLSCDAKVVKHHATGECEPVTRKDGFGSGYGGALDRLLARVATP